MSRVITQIACAVLLGAAASVPAAAAPIWSFDVVPAGGEVTGSPGDTVGWGYTIVNNDPTHWLAIAALNADPFQQGTPDPFVFDFPILAPGETRVRGYTATEGLFALIWDASAPHGFVNAGTFVLDADFYVADPLLGGALVGAAPTLSRPYTATVSAVPEPAILALLAAGAGAVRVLRQRQR